MASDIPITQLAVAMTASDTSATVKDGGSLPTVNFAIRIDGESMLVDSRSGNALSGITRARVSPTSAAASHPVGANVYLEPTPTDTGINVKDYGAVGDGTTDDTAAIQAAIDDAAPGDSSGAAKGIGKSAVLIFPPGHYRASQLVLRPGLAMRGSGVGHFGFVGANSITMIQQLGSQNKDFFVFTPWNFATADNVGPGEIRDLIIRGEDTNTLGCAISIRDTTAVSGAGTIPGTPMRIQDHFKITNVLIRGFAEHGISALRAGGPLYLHDVAIRDVGGYGLQIKGYPDDADMPSGSGAPTGANFTMVHLSNISGDGCKQGLAYFKNLIGNQGQLGSLVITGMKSEASAITALHSSLDMPSASILSQADVPQRYAIVFENCQFPVTINGLSHIANDTCNNFAPTAAIKILAGTNGPPPIKYTGVTVRKLDAQSGTVKVIEDSHNSRDILYDDNPNGVYTGADESNYSTQAFSNTPVTVKRSTDDPNGLTMQGDYAGGQSTRLFFWNSVEGGANGFSILKDANGLSFRYDANPGVASGTGAWRVEAGTGHWKAQSDNTFDIGAAGANRPRDFHIARNLVMGDVSVSEVASGILGLASGDSLRIATDGSTGTLQLGASGDVAIYRSGASKASLGDDDSFRIAHTSSTPDGHALVSTAAGNDSPRLFFYNEGTGAASGVSLRGTAGGTFRIATGGVPGSSSGTTRLSVFSNGNMGLGTETFGTNAAGVFAMVNGTAPTTSPADAVQLFSLDVNGAGTASLGVRTEQAVEASTDTATHQLRVSINGTVYGILLTNAP